MRKATAAQKRKSPAARGEEREHLQALTRGLRTIAHMNRVGVSTNGALAKRLGLKYSTAHRMLMVLTDLGLTQHDPICHQFTLAGGVRELAAGFNDVPLIDDIALPKMCAWTQRYGLPLLLVTESPGGMVVRAATDGQRPIFAERCITGSLIPTRSSCEAAVLKAFASAVPATAALRVVRRQGFAKRILKQQGEIHISVPLELRLGLRASLSIRCSLSIMEKPSCVERWAALLRQLAEEVATASV
jgi:DNA-binding IclR family transcriptional regulator